MKNNKKTVTSAAKANVKSESVALRHYLIPDVYIRNAKRRNRTMLRIWREEHLEQLLSLMEDYNDNNSD